MSPKKFNAPEWGRRLEAGERNDPTLLLASQLQQNRPGLRPLPPAFKEELRGRLLKHHPMPAIGQWALSAAMMLVLAAAVVLFWRSLASPAPTLTPGSANSGVEIAATAAATISEQIGSSPLAQSNQPLDIDNDNFVAVDLWQSPVIGHPQVADRFSLSLEEAQEQVSYAIQAPTILPNGFYFVGAAVTVVYPDQQLEPGVSMIFVQVAHNSPVLDFHQHPVTGSIANFDPHEYDDALLTIESITRGDDFSGDYQLDGRGGRLTLRWQANGFRYTLTLSGEVKPVEDLVHIANSLQMK
jgi:hypothetical protein